MRPRQRQGKRALALTVFVALAMASATTGLTQGGTASAQNGSDSGNHFGQDPDFTNRGHHNDPADSTSSTTTGSTTGSTETSTSTGSGSTTSTSGSSPTTSTTGDSGASASSAPEGSEAGGSGGEAGSSGSGSTTSGGETPAGAEAPSTGPQVESVDGSILVRFPGDSGFHRLQGAAALPDGTEIDAHGRTELKIPDGHELDVAVAWDGRFVVHYERAPDGHRLTELKLSDPLSCGAGKGHAAHAAQAGRRRGLWVRVRHGKFRTRGRFAAGTVRGTRWQTVDRCDPSPRTMISVTEGVVSVRDLVHQRTRDVPAGEKIAAGPGL